MTGTVVGWHLGDVGPRLARELGWRYVAAATPRAPAPPVQGPAIWVGYSAGCQGVRQALLAQGPRPVAVVCVDGTHGAMPPAAWQVDVWRRLAEEAITGRTLFVATTLGNHRYVERMGAGSYASTGLVLERALGLAEGTLRTPQTIRSGGLYVRSFPSEDTDKPAHAAQVREVLPALWSEVVVPHVTGGAPPAPADDATGDTDPAPAPGWADALPDGARLGLRCLAWLGYQAGLGVRELPGDRHDPRILAYSRECRRGGTFLGVGATGAPIWHGGSPLPLGRDEDAWCSALASATLLGAMRVGDAPPHGLRVSVRELVEDARGTGAWRGLDYVPRPGDLGIDARAGGDPTRGGTGHVWRVAQVEDGLALGIGGNEGNAIGVSWRALRATERRGWIAIP